MVKKTGLGKGLDALFSMPVAENEQRQAGDELRNLKVIDIEPNRAQARKMFDQDALEELADSIKMYGVIQPIVVTEKEGYYSIVAGERRLRAAILANMDKVPCIEMDIGYEQSAVFSILENVQRSDLSFFEEAAAIGQLVNHFGMTQSEVAKRLSKSLLKSCLTLTQKTFLTQTLLTSMPWTLAEM